MNTESALDTNTWNKNKRSDLQKSQTFFDLHERSFGGRKNYTTGRCSLSRLILRKSAQNIFSYFVHVEQMEEDKKHQENMEKRTKKIMV